MRRGQRDGSCLLWLERVGCAAPRVMPDGICRGEGDTLETRDQRSEVSIERQRQGARRGARRPQTRSSSVAADGPRRRGRER